MLLVNLGISFTSLFCLITEFQVNLCACLHLLWSLDPELVRPLDRIVIINLINLLDMNSKYVVALISFFSLDSSGIRTSSAI